MFTSVAAYHTLHEAISRKLKQRHPRTSFRIKIGKYQAPSASLNPKTSGRAASPNPKLPEILHLQVSFGETCRLLAAPGAVPSLCLRLVVAMPPVGVSSPVQGFAAGAAPAAPVVDPKMYQRPMQAPMGEYAQPFPPSQHFPQEVNRRLGQWTRAPRRPRTRSRVSLSRGSDPLSGGRGGGGAPKINVAATSPPGESARFRPRPSPHPPSFPDRRTLAPNPSLAGEEEAYAEKVAELFKTGRVPNCPEGTTMRALLADLLNCAPMRVSKKFSGERAIGAHAASSAKHFPGRARARKPTESRRFSRSRFEFRVADRAAGRGPPGRGPRRPRRSKKKPKGPLEPGPAENSPRRSAAQPPRDQPPRGTVRGIPSPRGGRRR